MYGLSNSFTAVIKNLQDDKQFCYIFCKLIKLILRRQKILTTDIIFLVNISFVNMVMHNPVIPEKLVYKNYLISGIL